MLSLFDAVTRHQVYIERHKAHIAKSFNDFLLDFDKKLKERMRDVNITAYSRNRMEALAAHVKADLIDAYGAHYGVWREQIVDFAEYEAGHQARKMDEAFGVEFAVPARAQLRKAVLSTPLSGIGGPNKADMLHAFYKSWAGSRVRTVEAIIYGGYYQGLTNTQIVNQIRGTKLNRFKDGQIGQARRDVEMLTRTAVQHAATQARMEVYDANADVIGGIQIVATLDDRTTPQCRSMDGRVFKLDEEHIPLPPYHVGCRSTTVPVMRPPFDALDKGAKRIARGPSGSELVPADMTYYEWLKTQPASFQNDAIGPRRAELLRNGGLSAKRFSELNLGRNFQPLTPEEMKRVEPGAFERAAKIKDEKELRNANENSIFLSSGNVGDELEGTKILSVGDIDFNDHKAVTEQIEAFSEKYARAEVEHALTITPSGKKYILEGQRTVVNPAVIGEGELKGSIGIHNHPLLYGGDSNDSFSRKDLRFAAGHEQGKQYLISGKRRNAFEFTKNFTPEEIETEWDNARYRIFEKHLQNGTSVVNEQEEILQELNNTLKGFTFYEYF